MNGLRRAFLFVFSLLLIGAAGGLIALVWNQERKLNLEIGDFNVQAFVASSNAAKYGVTAVLGAIALIAFIALVLAVLPTSSRSKGTLRMRQADGGTVEVTAIAIESLLRQELEQLPDVRSVVPKVALSGGAVETSLAATIEPSASIAQVTTDLAQGVASVLRTQVGVTNVKRPHIRISYDEMNARPVAPRTPSRPRPAAPTEFETPPMPPAGAPANEPSHSEEPPVA